MSEYGKYTRSTSDLILSGFMSFSFVYAFTTTLNFDYTPLTLLFYIAIQLSLYSLVSMSRSSLKITALISGAVLITSVVYLYQKELLPKIQGYLYKTAVWLINYINGVEKLNNEYAFLVTLGMCIPITLFIFIFSIKRFNFYVLLISGTALFTFQWILEYFVSYGAFYIFLLIVLVYYFKYIYIRNSLKRVNEFAASSQFVLWSAPVSAIIVAIAVFAPSSEKPIEWPWLDEKIATAVTYMNTTYTSSYAKFDYFSLGGTGFGNNSGSLGGKVRSDKTVVMEVEASRSTYLKTAGKDLYTGYSWLDTIKDSAPLDVWIGNMGYPDLNELNKGLPILIGSSESADKYYLKDKVTITYTNMRTKSLFAPAKLEKFEAVSNPANIFVNSNGTLTTDKTLSNAFKYSTEAYYIKYNDEDFKNVIRKSRKGLYEDILMRRNIPRGNNLLSFRGVLSNISFNDIRAFQENSRAIYSKYLQLPENLPQRVKDLAGTITTGAKNNYDRAKAIEQYFMANYEYTLSPKAPPKGQDFVDHFLFDSKQGYCTYYASAMVVLARSAGIPARYVEGYMMPSLPEKENVYYVTNEKAHAWVEIYFEGFGWLPFEPTSSFTSDFYFNATTLSSAESAFLGDYIPEEVTEESGRILEEDELEIGDYTAEESYRSVIIMISIVVLILLLLGVVIVNSMKSKLLIWKMKKMQPRESVANLYGYYVNILEAQGLGINPGETPLQYSNRVDRYRIFSYARFKHITEIFIIARYSNNEITDMDKKFVYDFSKDITRNALEELGRFKYFIYKYLLGRF